MPTSLNLPILRLDGDGSFRRALILMPFSLSYRERVGVRGEGVNNRPQKAWWGKGKPAICFHKVRAAAFSEEDPYDRSMIE